MKSSSDTCDDDRNVVDWLYCSDVADGLIFDLSISIVIRVKLSCATDRLSIERSYAFGSGIYSPARAARNVMLIFPADGSVTF